MISIVLSAVGTVLNLLAFKIGFMISVFAGISFSAAIFVASCAAVVEYLERRHKDD